MRLFPPFVFSQAIRLGLLMLSLLQCGMLSAQLVYPVQKIEPWQAPNVSDQNFDSIYSNGGMHASIGGSDWKDWAQRQTDPSAPIASNLPLGPSIATGSRAWFLSDGVRLYFGMRVYDPNTAQMSADSGDDTFGKFNVESVEVALSNLNGAAGAGQAYKFAMDGFGHIDDMYPDGSVAWDAGSLDSSSYILNGNTWACEFSIPLAQLVTGTGGSAQALALGQGPWYAHIGYQSPVTGGVPRVPLYAAAHADGFSQLTVQLDLSDLLEPTRGVYLPSDENILNPERGIFVWGPLESAMNYQSVRAQGATLVFGRISLDGFQNQPISGARLNEISQAFGRIRAAGLKCFPRVQYNDEIGQPDAPLSRIEQHLQQLKPVFDANKDVIAWFEAGFIGSWGEWHSSTNDLETPQARKAVMNLLLQYLPSDRFILVRTPMYKWTIFDQAQLTAGQAFSSAPIARVGHHNDCFLASETDLGTYPEENLTLWKSRVASDTRWVPMGGETCQVYEPRSTCAGDAVSEMAAHHWTYLHSGYHADVIQGLMDDGCWDTILRKLGYRFELVDADLPAKIAAGGSVPVTVRVRNVGWAPMYNARPVFLRIYDGNEVLQEMELAADVRQWAPGETVEIGGSLELDPGLIGRKISLALWLPDAVPALRSRSEYAVRMANVGVWDGARGHNVLAVEIPVVERSGVSELVWTSLR